MCVRPDESLLTYSQNLVAMFKQSYSVIRVLEKVYSRIHIGVKS
jgi:hypothetical protein